ncbi:hypothetical protein [Proteus myxofaciens]|uniref:Uncharacterized protein n=1 Tax=Proteus myxofaciens ATCC 19692 TaxID=1354337 RepID=A0A198GHY7_9GAMM|nr:hypothetical protein [Proteus myxofaciens]OAT37062.1 hypothetical protein M983_0441 [Proteus myxofaciens ATCC 19692]
MKNENININVNSKDEEKNEMEMFEMDLANMDEMEPIESPAFIWGKWNFAGS